MIPERLDMDIEVGYNHIAIPTQNLKNHTRIIRAFQIYNAIYHRFEDVAVDYRNGILYLPRGVSVAQLQNYGRPRVLDTPDPFLPIEAGLCSSPKEHQLSAIDFLIGEKQFSNSRVSSQIVLTAPPGFGKTFCGVVAVCYYKMRTLVVCHRKKILMQWADDLIAHTDMDLSEVQYLTTTLAKRIFHGEEIPTAKVYLATQQTFTFLSKEFPHGWDDISTLIRKMKIGLKIVDEAHRHFRNTFLLDSAVNIKKNIYMSATMNRSARDEDRIFQEAFRHTPRFGDHMLEQMRKHIIYIPVFFNSRPTYEEQLHMINAREYFDRNRFLDYQLKKEFIEMAMVQLYRKYFQHQEGRVMILSSKIDSANHFCKVMKREFPDRTVGVYHTGVLSDEKEEVMRTCDIVSSTPGSLGEGINMKGLRYLFMTEPFSSNVNAYQNPSRLREYAPDKYTFYIEFIDEGFDKIVQWQKRRLKHFKRFFVEQRTVYYNDLMKG